MKIKESYQVTQTDKERKGDPVTAASLGLENSALFKRRVLPQGTWYFADPYLSLSFLLTFCCKSAISGAAI